MKWNLPVLQEMFVPRDVELIMARQPSMTQPDSVSWKFNKGENLTVKSAYWLARE